MTQRESRLSTQILAELRARGAFCFKVHGGPTMMAGLPDIIGCYRGRFFGIETKLDTRVSVRQAYVHGLIERAGGRVVVAHSVAEALTTLTAMDGRNDHVWGMLSLRKTERARC